MVAVGSMSAVSGVLASLGAFHAEYSLNASAHVGGRLREYSADGNPCRPLVRRCCSRRRAVKSVAHKCFKAKLYVVPCMSGGFLSVYYVS